MNEQRMNEQRMNEQSMNAAALTAGRPPTTPMCWSAIRRENIPLQAIAS